jgi:hypothetical protein
MLIDPLEEGRKYCLTYGSEYRNPYPPGTDAHNLFERGWSQTLKKYPEEVARIDNKRQEERVKQQQEEVRKRTAAAEAYRNAKNK